MELSVGGLGYTFRLDEAGNRYVAPITLAEWEPFRSRNSVPGREGQHVLLECPMVYGDANDGKLADRAAYERSLEYFLNHRAAIQERVLAECVTFVHDLYAIKVKYETPDAESYGLAQVAGVEDLRRLIDLSYVQLFPYHREGLPYIGLRFEADWDEYGLLALLVGTEVLARGYSGTARAVDESIRDDGGMIR
jgi:hypothetical protein